jgi:ectoine hydroxylase-related dioxygenase (phytanoyl-CoA dioxygenase family)
MLHQTISRINSYSSYLLHHFDVYVSNILVSPKPLFKAKDPFLGLVPWELSSKASLTIPKNDENKIDLRYAKLLLDFAGVCTIKNIINKNTIQQCNLAADSLTSNVRNLVNEKGIDPDRIEGFSFKGLHQRDPGRIDIRNHIDMNSFPFNHKDFGLESESWMPIIHSVLGLNAKLLWKGIVVTDPGCKRQAYHPDGPPVSINEWRNSGDQVSSNNDSVALPPHCLTVFFPLVNLSQQNGATSFLCGTQHELTVEKLKEESENPGSSSGAGTPAIIYANAGDAIIFDVRVKHAGAANVSQDRRAMLYMVFGREWYDKKMHKRLLYESGCADSEASETLFQVIEEFK